MSNYKDIAIQYHEAGLKVIPFWNRTDKNGEQFTQFPKAYSRFRQEQTIQDINTLFWNECDGIALLCTDGIEAIDIDTKHDPTGTIAVDFYEAVNDYPELKAAADKCFIEKTKSGGWHIVYRTNVIAGNQKLAKRADGKEAVIETRGRGGILFVYPTPNYQHKSGSLLELPLLTDAERNGLIAKAREFDAPDPIKVEHQVKAQELKTGGTTPWDDFDARHNVLDLVERYGWSALPRQSNGEYVRLNRPGAKHSHKPDASVIVQTNVFYPFTTSSEFEPNKGYGPYAVYTVMEHQGDFTASARELYRQGYGERIEERQNPEQKEANDQLPDFIKKVEASRFDFNAKFEEPDPVLRCYSNGKVHNVGAFGQMGVFLGHEKMGKSFVLGCAVASGLDYGTPKLNFRLDIKDRKVMWFDLEQSKVRYRLAQQRLHWIANAQGNHRNYMAYNLRPFNPTERLAIIEYYLKKQRPGILVLDGYVDLVNDYNDLKESQAVVNTLMRWTDEYNLLMMGVLHLNKGDGKPRGHIGSELKNKADFMFKVAKADEFGSYELSNPTNGTWPEFKAFEFCRDESGLPVVDEPTSEPFF